jgi:hypothetical protein
MLLCVALALPAMAQDVGKDVKPDHWAYDAIQDLAKKGLIQGYPPDGRFLGGRTITRYEMAALIKRVVDRMDNLLKAVPPSGASKEEVAKLKEDQDKLKSSLDEISRMVSEFKTQLTVIGTDMEQVKKDLMSLREQLGALGTKVDGFDERINNLTKKVDQASVLADQALENITELKNNTNAALAKKVDVGVGKLRATGLMQAWYANPLGDSLGGNFGKGGNLAAAPPGRNYGGGVGDTFRLRRGEIALEGEILPYVNFRAMFDITKNSTGSGSVLQDLWVGYQFARNFRVEVGQEKTQLSEEGTRSSSQLLTVERSIMNGLPTNVGRVGDIRDTGAVLKYKGTYGSAALGIWNDNGVTQNVVDTDRFKFATATGYFTGIRHLTLGVWGGTNLGDFQPQTVRDRAGATVIWQSGPHYFEAEGAYTLDHNGGTPLNARTIGLGGYVLYAHTISRKWQVVARYDEWDPAVHGGIPVSGAPASIPFSHHNLREYTVGVNYYMKGHNAKIQANYVIEDTQANGVSFFGARRQLILTNFQTAY